MDNDDSLREHRIELPSFRLPRHWPTAIVRHAHSGSRTALCLSLTTTLGCVAQVPPPASAPPAAEPSKPVYYVAKIGLASDEAQGGVETSVEPLADDAARVLRKGIKVAFQPPDACMTTTAAPEGASRDDYISMNCGVLIASLEKITAKAGYQVISWQGLKDARERPLEKAKELGVQVLFEVNQLSANERMSGTKKTTELSFHQQSTPDDRTGLAVDDELAGRCKAAFDATFAETDIDVREKSATLDIKAVEVKSGRSVWYYQKTVRDEADTAQGPIRDFYFPASPEGNLVPVDIAPAPKYNTDQRTGVGLLAGGGATTVLGAVLLGLSLERFSKEGDERPKRAIAAGGSTIILLGGVAMAAFGTVLLVRGNKAANKYNAQRPTAVTAEQPMLLPPDETLCVGKAVQPDFAGGTVAPLDLGTDPEKKTSFSFSEQTSGGSGDAERRERERLFRLVAEDFTGELGTLTAG